MTVGEDVQRLEAACYDTLAQNTVQTNGYVYTAPDKEYYTHQWLWDSALAVKAWALVDPERAVTELVSLVDRGQWEDGMIPNMVLTGHGPENFLWRSKRNPHAPAKTPTSGITQPPMLAEAVWEIAAHLEAAERLPFLGWSLGRLVGYHTWLHSARDFGSDGLFSVAHPYETGMDNNPALTTHMHRADWRLPAIGLQALRHGTAFIRRDTRRFEAGERASLEDTTLCAAATLRLRKLGYNQARLPLEHPFLVEDAHFNSVLVRNDELVLAIAEELGQKLPEKLHADMAKTKAGIEKLWDAEAGLYFSRDALTGEPIRVPTIASLMPLYTGQLPEDRAQTLVNHLYSEDSFGGAKLVASTPPNAAPYRHNGYWSGAVWPFTSHLLSDGAIRIGQDEVAEIIDYSFLQSVLRHGPREYFSSQTGVGHGSRNFSPTAAQAAIILNRRKAALLDAPGPNLEAALEARLEAARHPIPVAASF